MPYLAGGTRQVSAHYVPDRDSSGTVRGYFALVEDVSDRKHKEALLADARLRLSLALQAGQSGAFEWDVRSNANVWSDELLALYGLSRDQFTRSHDPWLECVHPDDLPRMRETFARMLIEGDLDAEYRILRRDSGELRWLQARGQVSYDDAHNPIRVLGISVDVTEHQRAEEALREADRRKDEFLSMLAHELRNPLAPIRTAGYLLVDKRTDMDTMRRLGSMVQRQVANLSRIVDDLLDVARIRTGKIELRKEIVVLEGVVDHAVETLQGVLDERRKTVTVTRSAEGAYVEADPVRLEQMIVNLLVNASKFSPQLASIEVSVEAGDDVAIVRVRDPGIGIEAQLLPRVFDLFAQAAQSLDRSSGGLGIGLTLVRWIVE